MEIIIFSLCIFCFLIYFIYIIFYKQENMIVYKEGDKQIKVDNNFINYPHAGKILSILDEKNKILIKHLNQKFINNETFGNNHEPNQLVIINGVKQLTKNYNTNNLEENTPIIGGDTSYSLNKGKLIKICLRNIKEDYTIHDLNTITFVVLHELAHVFSKSYGHNNEFWINFKFLLQEANDINLIEIVDYHKEPISYCNGMMITYNPYFDESLPDLSK